MELFNKGSRKIDSLKSQESDSFSDEQGAKLLALYPDELCILGTETIVMSSDSEINEYVVKLEAEIADKDATIAKLEAALAKGNKLELLKQIADLQAIVDTIADKDATIESLKAEIEDLKALVAAAAAETKTAE